MFNSILVPLDGSKRAEAIFPYVEEIAQTNKATVIFLEVIDPMTTRVTPYEMVPYIDTQLVEELVTEAREYLAACAARMQEKGVETKTFVEQGPIVRTILDVAERENVQLIAMASHGRTGLARVFYGSVAAGILQQVDRPLLLIRATDTQ